MTLAYPRWHWRQLLLANACIVATYAGTFWLRKWLDLPPGYAVPLFPPAGVGFALAVVAGWRVLPGVTLGALLLDLPGLWLPGMPESEAWKASVAVTLGLLLQTWLGAFLFRRLVNPALDSPRDVTRFLFVAPCMSLVSASITVPALYRLGAVTEEMFVGNWLAWWAGDTVGVLLAAPLCWIVTAPPRALWRSRARQVGMPLLLAAAAVLAVYEQAANWETVEHLQTFRVKAQQVADEIQAEFNEHGRFVDTLARALGDNPGTLPEAKFEQIARGYVEGRAEIRGVNWAVRISDAERPSFEAWARTNVQPGFGIHNIDARGRLSPAQRRPLYYPLLYVTPPSIAPARGLDFLSEPVRADTLRRSIRNNGPAASAPLYLATIQRPGLVLMRVVGAGAEPQAMVALIIDSGHQLQRAFEHAGMADFDYHFVDVTAAGARVPVAGAAWDEPRRGQQRLGLRFADRRYELMFAPRPSYFGQQYGWASWTVLTAGLILTGLLGALMLLTSGERARIQALVTERTARLQAVLDNAGDAIVTADADGNLVSANPATARLFGSQPAQLAGQPLTTLLPAAAGETSRQMLARLAHAGPDECELQGANARGERFPLSVSVAPMALPAEQLYVCILHDLTEQHRSQESIYRLAHFDALTGLLNRHALGGRLEEHLAHARRSGEAVAVVFIDLDHFKKINDSYGHEAGDELLVGAAQRMKELLRHDVDTLARLGGDEFVIVLGGPLTPDSVTAVAVRLVQSLAQPYQLQAGTVHSGSSVGVALYPADGQDATTLMRHADTAMYAAKREGRGNFQFFSEQMNAATREHLRLERRMRAALAEDGFDTHLQPQIELATGRVVGAEMLLRWNDSELGQVAPARAIAVAEECGLIVPLGDWVLTRAMAMLAEWRDDGMDGLRLAVNLSARQFAGSTLPGRLEELAAQHRIDPTRLELEITETAAMRDPEHTRQLLRQLRNRGFRLAIDDFGTGYSSLAYLKLFAIDQIKIDRSFVHDIETDPNDAAIVAATIALAHSLGLAVVAEGVETHGQRDFLRQRLSDEAQGFLFARPMPAAQFREFVRERAQLAHGC